jgi:gliding motility-associated-like protein
MKIITTGPFRRFALITLLLPFLFFSKAKGQIANTNAGTDFWFGFPEEIDQLSVSYNVCITSLVSASGQVCVPGQSYCAPFTVAPNVLTIVTIPSSYVVNTTADGVQPMAIHVTANNTVSVFTQGTTIDRAAASIALPTPFLGTSYTTLSWWQNNNQGSSSEIMVVGTGTPVTVTITPSIAVGVHPAHVAYNVTIPANDVYQLKCGNGDLTGTNVVATNGIDKFALINGNCITNVSYGGPCNNDVDPLYSQSYPTIDWGKSYVFIPTPLINQDVCRVLAAKDSTKVYFNGIYRSLLVHPGDHYDTNIAAPCYINANKPVEVGKFLWTGDCVSSPYMGAWSDPEEIVQGANEQMFVDSISFYATTLDGIDSNWATIVTRTSDVNRILFNGVNIGSSFTALPAPYNNYSYTVKSLAQGAYIVEDTGGCGVLVYVTGIGGAISYGYTAGIAISAFPVNPPINACLSDSVQLLSNVPGTPSTWAWDFGDGSTSNVANPWHTYTTTGQKIARLIATYPCVVDTVYDTINMNVVPTIGIAPATDTFCKGSSVIIAVSGSATTYNWTPTSGLSCTNCANPIASPTVTTKYIVTASNGVCAATDSSKIVIKPDSVISISPPKDTICIGSTAVLAASGSANYNWSPSTDLSCTGCASPNANPTTPTSYTVVGTNSFGCNDTAKITLWVKPKPVPAIKVVPATDSICLGDSAHLIASGGRIYLWSPGSSSADSIWVKPASNSTFTVNVSNGQCSVDTSVTIQVNPVPNITLTQPSNLCAGDSIILTATGGGNYLWNTHSTDSIIKVGPAATTTYSLTVSNKYGCKSTASTTVTVITISVNACCNDSIGDGDTVHLDANGGSSYAWIPANSLSCSNCPNPIASPTVTTTYTVTGTDVNGCSSEKTVTIEVGYLCGELQVPNVFTPNADGINDELVVSAPPGTSYNITIFDRWGKQVFATSNPTEYWNGKINNSGAMVPDGVYYYVINITCTNKTVAKKGFVQLIGAK